MKLSDIRRIRTRLASGEFAMPDLVMEFLSRISSENPDVNAFTQVHRDGALERARIIQQKIDAGTAGPLAGVVMGIKEVLCQKGFPATCASGMLASYEAVYDATVVERLLEQDAIIIGRLNMDEFAMGSSNENTIYGPVRNPQNHSRVAGGSSGGSAAAVAAGMCHATLGSDTGGSIRQPASFCGVVGLKPSYGRVSRHGLIAYASSFDSIGPLASSVYDVSVILKAIAGHDPRDATSSTEPVPDYAALLAEVRSDITIGIPAEYFGDGLDPEIHQQIMAVARKMEQKGAKLVEISLPNLRYAVAAYYVLATAEASSNLARFDGVRFGHRADIANVRAQLKAEGEAMKAAGSGSEVLDSPMIRLYKQSRTEGFGSEVKRRIMLGTYVLSAGYYDAYYAKAQRIRRLIAQDFTQAFSTVDVIISPAAPSTAFELGSKVNDPLQMYLSDIYTISANLAGICGISIPVGNHSKDDMPVGVQFMADAFRESDLFNAARLAEMVCDTGTDEEQE